MKAPAFDYARPGTLDEVFALMARARRRRAAPRRRPDAARDAEHAPVGAGAADRPRRVDALQAASPSTAACCASARSSRIAQIEESSLVARHAPLLTMAAPHIAHRAIRNRGTLGGSIAYADPAAEWPVCLVALDGVVVVRGPGGERRVAGARFLRRPVHDRARAGEVITACEIRSGRVERFAFDELARARRLRDRRPRDRRAPRAGRHRAMRLAYLGVATCRCGRGAPRRC